MASSEVDEKETDTLYVGEFGQVKGSHNLDTQKDVLESRTELLFLLIECSLKVNILKQY